MTAIIRKVKREDISEIIRLCKAHADFEKSDYDSRGKAAILSKALFEDGKLYCLIAELDKQVVGYTTFMRQYSTWDAAEYLYMDCLYLDEICRGQRIGERLLNKIKEFGLENGISMIQWQTPEFNKRAIKFYKRMGASCKSKERFYLLY